jgi:hypothetical protein
VIAIAGLVTTLVASLAGSLLPGWLNARNEDKVWRRDARAAVYADALSHIQSAQESAEGLTDDFYIGGRGKRPDLPHPDLITARMRLLASPEAFEKWRNFLASEYRFNRYLDEWDRETLARFGESARSVPLSGKDSVLMSFLASVEEANAAIQDSFGSRAGFDPDHGPRATLRRPATYVASESRPKPSQSARHRRAMSAAGKTGSPASRFSK